VLHSGGVLRIRLPSPADQLTLGGQKPLLFKRFEHERDTLRTQRRIAIGNVKVQVRGVGVSGVSQQREDISAMNLVPDLDPNTSRLQMRIKS